MNPSFRSFILALAFLAGGTTAWGDALESTQEALDDLAEAAELLQKADRSKDRVNALAQTVRAYEDGLQAMREGLRSIAVRERNLRVDFDQRRDQISRLLGVLQTLERASTPLLLIHPTGPVGTARSGMMLSEITPGLQAQAEELRLQLEELSSIQVMQKIAEDDLVQGLKSLNEARVKLNQAVASRTDLPKRIFEEPEKIALLARTSETLDQFAQILRDVKRENLDRPIASFEDAKGTIDIPAQGRILRKFNEEDAAGIARPGLVVASAGLSLVSAPWASTILYSGPFLDYGNVIILEPEVDYLIVLAGISQTYGSVGDILRKGDPIGLMGGKGLEVGDLMLEVSQASENLAEETLYIEFRKDGEPIDPIEWIKNGKG